MNRQELILQINEVLADEFEIDVADIRPEGSIKETLQLDSLSLVDMVALIETTFNVKIKGAEIIHIQTFGNLYDFLHERIHT
ncbi:MAG: phosphopantetheine-binding protein [Tannerella sp.]|jgi:acyl carrier protein|nr:phosphopantetheine-binding protein [Tannerella sp.]